MLVSRDQNFAALVPALFRARLLIFNVITRHADLNKAPNQIAHMRVSAVAGVGVGDDERTKIDSGRRLALLFGHAGARKMLIAVRGQQRPHQHGRFVGHLAQRIARQVWTGIFIHRAFRRRCPSPQVNTFDAHALDHHALAR